MSNPGDWYAALTPDKKHVAVIAKYGHEKDKSDQFKYFLLDENLKETGTSQFSFAGNTKQIGISKFFASNKGDIYILADEFDKSYKMPVLYQYTPGGQANIIPVMMADPTLRNLSYTAKLDPSGNLLVAGYAQKKKAFVADDPDAVATYIFSSAKPNEVKVSNFDQPIKGLAARNILFNGNTYFLVGEQYRPEKVRPQGNALSMDVLKDVFDYTHGDIEVTGFSADLTKKFDMPISRKMPAQRDMDSDLGVASGIVNNKLVVVFNDLHGKYIDDKYYKTLKLPVAVAVTNDGLMEAPVTFAKEFDVKLSTYKLHPAFFNADGSKLVVLSVNDRSVKTATFK